MGRSKNTPISGFDQRTVGEQITVCKAIFLGLDLELGVTDLDVKTGENFMGRKLHSFT